MDKSVEQLERLADLSRYVPEFLRGTVEFRQLWAAQESELKRLYEKMDELWKDSLIPTATIQGIKRYEAMIGLKPYPGDGLEERRAAVFLKWNQQLPYTRLRLRERLELVVGAEGYELWVRNQDYELELWILDQPYRVLESLRDMTRQMIPANLRFIFAGKYPGNIKADVAVGNSLEMAVDFYARYNREFLYLDGSWLLDGTCLLNGYKEMEALDLYPVEAEILSDWCASAASEEAVGYETFAEEAAGTTAALRTGAAAGGRPICGERLGFQWEQPAAPEIACCLRAEHNLWYLDGESPLNGTRFLDAEIFEYIL